MVWSPDPSVKVDVDAVNSEPLIDLEESTIVSTVLPS